MRIAGITVRVGLLYLVWMAFQIGPHLGKATLANQAWVIGALFVIVLLHEFGHCFACRWVGGEADRILMWPLGGLASCRPPHTWWANFVTTAGGPLVNVALVPVLGGILLALGQGWGVLIFSPLTPSDGWAALDPSRAPVGQWLLTMTFWTYFANWLMLLFNVLVPMFPMDGGRLLQALLWKRMGWRRSMEIATTVGLGAAIVMGLFAVTSGQMILFAIALFGGLTCWAEKQRLKMMAAGFGEIEESPWAASLRPDNEIDSPRAKRAAEQKRLAAEKQRQAAQAEAVELDRILAKIKASGMGSLSRSEESFLRKTNEKLRQK